MATWIAHLRIAENIMRSLEYFNNRFFLVGNIGPDCGVPNEDWSKFTPDGNKTHWKINGKIDSDDFKSKYLDHKATHKSFYMGYYVHLLADVEWEKLFSDKKKTKEYQPVLTDRNYIWTIKKDWYGQDVVYLRKNKQSVFYTDFIKIKEFKNDYFDFYPENAFIRQIKYISDYYLNYKENIDREFIYLSESEMDDFVERTTLIVLKEIKNNI